MLRVHTKFSLENFENGLKEIGEGENTLVLPNKIVANAVGCKAALLQLICTWQRTHPEGANLKLYAESTGDIALENCMNTPFGLMAVNLATNVGTFTGMPLVRSELLKKAKKYVEAMHNGNLEDLIEIDKTTIPIMCLDNAKRLNRPNRLYSRVNWEVLPRQDFENLIVTAYNSIPLTKGKLTDEIRVQAMASLLYEAFLNTHDHAQTDHLGNFYSRSVRGIIFSFQTLLLDKIVSRAGSSEPLKAYFQEWRPAILGTKQANFIEMSIFDCGPGLAESWLSKLGESEIRNRCQGISIEQEFEAVKACLEKGGTTKESDARGNGLFRITQVVKRAGGFLRIRTGRLSLIKAFGAYNGQSASRDDSIFEDAESGGRPLKPKPWADGTTITVMIPLNRASK
jgi:hypothetical protein